MTILTKSEYENKMKFAEEQWPYLNKTFPGFTYDMVIGNAPNTTKGKDINGNVIDSWSTVWGGAETVNDEIICANFSLNSKITIYIAGNTLNICDHRYAGDFRCWNYCNNSNRIWGSGYKNNQYDLELDKVEAILNVEIPNCKLWDLVRKRAEELYGKY